MAKAMYAGIGGVSRKIKKQYVGINGVSRKITKEYVGINGVSRLCYSGGWFADLYFYRFEALGGISYSFINGGYGVTISGSAYGYSTDSDIYRSLTLFLSGPTLSVAPSQVRIRFKYSANIAFSGNGSNNNVDAYIGLAFRYGANLFQPRWYAPNGVNVSGVQVDTGIVANENKDLVLVLGMESMMGKKVDAALTITDFYIDDVPIRFQLNQ